MGGYASGKYALGICDQCGQQFMLNDLKKTWDGFKVCYECYEPKHPQLEPLRAVSDPEALKEPRPEKNEIFTVYVGIPGDSTFQAIGMQPAPISQPVLGNGFIGEVTIVIS